MILYVAIGSALGGVARYLLAGFLAARFGAGFPVGTLAINVTGSFLITLFFELSLATPSISPEVRTFLTVGVCGGYTTFSAFSFETVRLLQGGDWRGVTWYVVGSVVLSIAAAFAGIAAAAFALDLRRAA